MIKRNIAKEITAGLEETLAIVSGDGLPARAHHVSVPVVDVKALRKKLKLSQKAFGLRFGFNARTVQDWEQGRSRPENATRILLGVIAKNPQVVDEVLAEAKQAT